MVLIDGSNFYFKLKDLKLHNLLRFNFSGFVRMLAGGYRIIRVVYYIGKVRTDNTSKTLKLHDDQQKLFACLRKQGIYYSLGFSHKPSVAMVANCSVSKLLSKEEITPFITAFKNTPQFIAEMN